MLSKPVEKYIGINFVTSVIGQKVALIIFIRTGKQTILLTTGLTCVLSQINALNQQEDASGKLLKL